MQSNNTHEQMKLSPWSFFLSLEEGEEGDVGNFDNLETDTGNITLCVTAATETRNENLEKYSTRHQTHMRSK